jgi:hypothetical protein
VSLSACDVSLDEVVEEEYEPDVKILLIEYTVSVRFQRDRVSLRVQLAEGGRRMVTEAERKLRSSDLPI